MFGSLLHTQKIDFFYFLFLFKMKINYFYYAGCFFLFIGLLWMFLPHAFHQRVLSEKEEIKHIIHIFEGLVFVVIGLVLIIFSNKNKKSRNK